jgi:ribose transport system permease protein
VTTSGQDVGVRSMAFHPTGLFAKRWGFCDCGPLVALASLLAALAVADPRVLSLGNLQSILETAAIPVILVVGATFVLMMGSVDL